MTIEDKLTAIANNVPLVYDAGFEAGKKVSGDSWYDTFWDKCQNLGLSGNAGDVGLRDDWRYAFANQGWRDGNYDPKYLIRIKGNCEGMYQLTGITKKVTVNMDECTSARTMFYYANVTEIGEMNLSLVTNTQYLCSNATKLTSIEKIISSAETKWNSTTFEQCKALTHVIFEGVIAQNGLNLKDSTGLDKDSITSIINCLSTATTDLTVTLSLDAVNNAFEGGRDGTEWQELIATKSNWTIAYV